jgi:hypothetical protein
MLAFLLSSYASLLSNHLYYLTLQLAMLDYYSNPPPTKKKNGKKNGKKNDVGRLPFTNQFRINKIN